MVQARELLGLADVSLIFSMYLNFLYSLSFYVTVDTGL